MTATKLIPCLCAGVVSLSCSIISSNPCIIPTTTPPVTGIRSILCQVSASLCRRSHAAPSLGVPAHAHSWMT
uniref:Secreted protein n=1 Tax=Arundo donax TaxID=35708 RepID=A0A0A9DTW7_ARUDO